MKTLLIVRHAKSSWGDPALDDLDRPLNRRGKEDASRMGAQLKKRNFQPDCVISSPAKRARKTAKDIALAAGIATEKIQIDAAVYMASAGALTEIIQNCDPRFSRLMIVGHNPGLTDLVNILSDLKLDNLPTCGMVAFGFNIGTWKEVKPGKGMLEFYDFPKQSGSQ